MTEQDELPFDAEDALRRARQCTWFAGMLAVVVGFATAFRPLVSDVGFVFTLLGVVNSTLLAGLWLVLRSGRMVSVAPHLLMAMVTAILLPLLLMSGGANSQFAPFIPLFPICAVMLGNRRLTIITMVFWLVVLVGMFFMAGAIPDLTGAPQDPEKAASRIVWLALTCIVALAFALHFDRTAERLKGQLLDMAQRDPLTGVANRRALDATLTRILALASRQGNPVTLMIIDVDHFKRFNDTRGHAEGDKALQEVAAALERQLRAGQDLVARFGGEEFVVVLADTDRTSAHRVAEKLRVAIQDLELPYELGGPETLTATIGHVTVTGHAALGHDELLRRADAALYHGKKQGRDQAVDADDLPNGRVRATFSPSKD